MIRRGLCLFALMVPLSAQQLPPDAAALKAKRNAKIAEINRTYAAELDKLQKKAMDGGNLTAANEIQKEIESVTPDPFSNGDKEILQKLRGTSWKHEGTNKVMTFREDGKLGKSWGKLNPEWTVKNEVVSVEDSKIRISSDWKSMSVKGGDKVGKWTRLEKGQ
jgi:co-chaperonin GroES (HSP10)